MKHSMEKSPELELFDTDAIITEVAALLERQDREKYEDIKRVVDIQGDNGNWNYDPYMHGMYNGMELILAMLENREPAYKDAPDEWLDETLKSAQEQH